MESSALSVLNKFNLLFWTKDFFGFFSTLFSEPPTKKCTGILQCEVCLLLGIIFFLDSLSVGWGYEIIRICIHEWNMGIVFSIFCPITCFAVFSGGGAWCLLLCIDAGGHILIHRPSSSARNPDRGIRVLWVSPQSSTTQGCESANLQGMDSRFEVSDGKFCFPFGYLFGFDQPYTPKFIICAWSQARCGGGGHKSQSPGFAVQAKKYQHCMLCFPVPLLTCTRWATTPLNPGAANHTLPGGPEAHNYGRLLCTFQLGFFWHLTTEALQIDANKAGKAGSPTFKNLSMVIWLEKGWV